MPEPASDNRVARGPMEGLRVLDLTWQIAGPYCTKLLADYGADVIKIERPEGGDPSRAYPPSYHDIPNREGSLHFLYLNTNKRSVVLDLKSEDGRQTFLGLAREADIVVENFRPGVLARLGISWQTLHALNPRLILTSISNFGQTGQNRDLAASELVEYAMSGMMAFSGRQSREPLKHGLSQGQYGAGANAAYITAAVAFAQARGAAGQWIDVSIQEALAAELVMNEPFYAWMGGVQGRKLSADGGLGDIMPAKDGHVVLQLGATLSWSDIVALLEEPTLGEERFSTPQGRALHADEMNALVGQSLKRRGKHELFQEAAKRRILFGIAQDPADLLACPQLTARGFWVNVDHPTTGPLPYPGEPIKMSATPWQLRRPAPLLGGEQRATGNGQRGGNEHETGDTDDPFQNVSPSLRGKGPGVRWAGQRSTLSPERTSHGSRITDHGSRPLEGIRVLDLSSVFAMPYAAAIMGDLGAEVFKIEALHHLDQTHGTAWGIWPENDAGLTPWNVSGPFCTLNRGKRSLTLDLSKEDGRTVFKDLVRTADVVIENNTARVMRGWGLDYAHLRQIRPDIIMVSNTGYGHNSPWESYPVQGTALEPMTGICHFSGYIGDRPWKIAQSYPDFLATWHALFCLMAALRHRELTGEGQWLDVGMYQLNVSFLGEAILDYAANGRLGGRIGNRDHLGGVQGCYQTQGDPPEAGWMVVSARSDAEWRALCALIGSSDWISAAPATIAEARERHDEVDRVLATWASSRTRESAVDACRAAGLPAGPVNDARDLLLDPHLRARGFYEMVEHTTPAVGHRPVIGRCFILSETPLAIRRPAPTVGEGNEAALEGLLGISSERHRRLREEKITGAIEPLAQPPPSLPIADQIRTGRIHMYDPDYRAKLGLDQSAGSSELRCETTTVAGEG